MSALKTARHNTQLFPRLLVLSQCSQCSLIVSFTRPCSLEVIDIESKQTNKAIKMKHIQYCMWRGPISHLAAAAAAAGVEMCVSARLRQ